MKEFLLAAIACVVAMTAGYQMHEEQPETFTVVYESDCYIEYKNEEIKVKLITIDDLEEME